MPNVIDHGSIKREALVEFLIKHLPCTIGCYEELQETQHFWQTGETISNTFSFSREDSDEEEIDVAKVPLAEPNTIYVFDRSFLEDFTDLAAKYERYNPSVAVTVIVKETEDN
jgi:hypothetical protein